MDNDTFYEFLLYFAKQAKITIEKGNKVFINSYTGDGYNLQFILEAIKKEKKIDIGSISIHHTSKHVWNLKVVTETRAKGAYLVTAKDGHHGTVIKFVNHDSDSERYKEDEIVKAQVVGFVVSGNIYESEKEYEEATKDKARVDNGCMAPFNLLINNSSKTTKSERDSTLPDEDRILTAKFTIKSCHKIPLHIFEHDFPTYYSMEVETPYGDMDLFFSIRTLDKLVKQFKKGDIFAGNIMLSGDVYFDDGKKK